MARYIGDQNQTGFFYESGTYANTSGTLQWIGQVQDHTLNEEENIEQIRYHGGASRDVDVQQSTARDADGTLTYYPQDFKFLALAMGSNIDEGIGPYTHTMTAVNSEVGNAFTSGTLNPFVSFGFEDSKTAYGTGKNMIRTGKGCIVNTINITGEQKGILSCSVNYHAKEVNFSSGAKSAITAATTRPFLFHDAKLQIPNGTLYQEMTSFDLGLSNTLERDHYPNGSAEPEISTPTNRVWSLGVTLHASSERAKILYDQYYKGGSVFNAKFTIDAASTAGAGSRLLDTTLSGCRITAYQLPSPKEGINENIITITPKTVTAIATDSIATYNAW